MSLLNPCHGEKRSAKPTFSLSQMSHDELAQSLPWREKISKANVLVKPDEQSSNSFDNSAIARKGRML